MEILGVLPMFKGFYGSLFEADEDIVIESPYTYDDYDFDYTQYHNDVGKYLTEVINKKLKELFNFDIEIEFKEIVSPRFYNYSNDKIEVIYKLNEETIEDIYNNVQDRILDFEDYILEHFTSRDGYIPFYSNKVNDWMRGRKGHEITDYNVLNVLLEFLLECEWVDNQSDFYMEVADGMPIVYGQLKSEVE